MTMGVHVTDAFHCGGEEGRERKREIVYDERERERESLECQRERERCVYDDGRI